MGKRGPKPRVIDEIRLKQLASLNATIEDIARQLDCSRDYLEKHHKKMIDKCKAEFRSRILLAQLKSAERGNAALLIWLGKQHLCQQESTRIEHEGTVSVKIGKLAVRDSSGRVLVFSSDSSDVEEYAAIDDTSSTADEPKVS